MLVYSLSTESFSYAQEIIKKLNGAINTTYIPSGLSIEEVVNDFARIQLSHTFSEGYSNAGLSMVYDEKSLIIYYSSTSGTCVNQRYDNSVVDEIKIEVNLPVERIGGNYYQALMQEMYPYDWYEINRKEKSFTIVTPSELFKVEQQQTEDFTFPIPKFVFDLESNWYFEQEDLETIFSEFGYQKINAIGYAAIWHNHEMYYEYIVLDKKRSWQDNKLFVLREADDYTNSRISYRKVLQILEKKRVRELDRRDYDSDAVIDEE